MSDLKVVGYWTDLEVLGFDKKNQELYKSDLELPDPRVLVELLGKQEVDDRVVSYLRKGHELFSYLGYSYCRFNCGVAEDELGSRDLTDGVWVWPEGLAHYVESHGVALPEAFLNGIERNNWSVPEVVNTEALSELKRDLSGWNKWYEEKTRGGNVC